jgi:8-oxo-dGTP diphosphatase
MLDSKHAVLCYIYRDGETLMIYRGDPNDFLYNTHVPPGGGIEEWESSSHCVHRETKQETGLRISDVKYRGVVLFDHSGRLMSGKEPRNQLVDIYCTTRFEGTLQPENERNPPIWIPNHKIVEASGWNGSDRVLKLLQDGRLFNAVIEHRPDGARLTQEEWIETRLSGNPYQT